MYNCSSLLHKQYVLSYVFNKRCFLVEYFEVVTIQSLGYCLTKRGCLNKQVSHYIVCRNVYGDSLVGTISLVRLLLF